MSLQPHQTKRILVISLFLIGIAVLIGLIFYFVKNWPKFEGIFFKPTGTPPKYLLQDVVLEGYSYDLTSAIDSYAIFKYKGEHFVVKTNEIQNPVNLKDIFPTFTGDVIDMVAVTPSSPPEDKQFSAAFFVFSTNGNAYTNYPGQPYSQTLWEGWMFLPARTTSLVGVDAKVGKSNLAYPGAGLSFSFYYTFQRGKDKEPIPGTVYIEEGCTETASTVSMSGKVGSCPNSSAPFDTTKFGSRICAITHSTQTQVLTSDGNLYDESGKLLTVWEPQFNAIPQFLAKVYAAEHASSQATLALATIDSSESFNNEDFDFHLMAADHEHTIPYFMTNEVGISYLVTPGAKKITLEKVIKSPHGKYLVVHDFTKLTTMENDFLILAADGYMYNPYFPPDANGYHRMPFSDIESGLLKRSTQVRQTSWLSGVTHVQSYTRGYKVCFFFSNGDWYFVDFQLKDSTGKITRKFLGVDSEYFYNRANNPANHPGQISWLDWPHIKPIVSDIQRKKPCRGGVDTPGCSTDTTHEQYMVGISYDDWTVYMWGTDNVNGKMYSFSKPPPGDCGTAGGNIPGPGCWRINLGQFTGLGSWKDIDSEKNWGTDKEGNPTFIGTHDDTKQTIDGWHGISVHSIPDGKGNLIGVKYWTNFDDAVASMPAGTNVMSFDHVLMKASYYEAAFRDIAVIDSDSEIFVKESFRPTYDNAFCIKHKSGKYLYYDFINGADLSTPITPKLALGDTCVPMGPFPGGDPASLPQAMVEGLGAMWGYSADLDPASSPNQVCLTNKNPGLGSKNYITSKYSGSGDLESTCDEKWSITNGALINSAGKCLLSTDGSTVTFGSGAQCNGEWSITKLPCPNKAVCGTTELTNDCAKTCNLGSCDCNAPTLSAECQKACDCMSTCQLDCLGPIFASQCAE